MTFSAEYKREVSKFVRGHIEAVVKATRFAEALGTRAGSARAVVRYRTAEDALTETLDVAVETITARFLEGA